MLSPNSHFTKWKPTTIDEMKGFVALQILFQQNNQSRPITPANFRKQVVGNLLKEYVPVKIPARGRPSKNEIPDRLTARHFLAAYEDKRYKPDCIVCSNRQTDSTSSVQHKLKQCHEPMHLHAVTCLNVTTHCKTIGCTFGHKVLFDYQ